MRGQRNPIIGQLRPRNPISSRRDRDAFHAPERCGLGGLQPEGHGTVIDQRHLHIGPEYARGYGAMRGPCPVTEIVKKAPRLLGSRRHRARCPRPSGAGNRAAVAETARHLDVPPKVCRSNQAGRLGLGKWSADWRRPNRQRGRFRLYHRCSGRRQPKHENCPDIPALKGTRRRAR